MCRLRQCFPELSVVVKLNIRFQSDDKWNLIESNIEPRTWKGYLVGYNWPNRFYRLYHPLKRHVLVARHVTLDESVLYRHGNVKALEALFTDSLSSDNAVKFHDVNSVSKLPPPVVTPSVITDDDGDEPILTLPPRYSPSPELAKLKLFSNLRLLMVLHFDPSSAETHAILKYRTDT